MRDVEINRYCHRVPAIQAQVTMRSALSIATKRQRLKILVSLSFIARVLKRFIPPVSLGFATASLTTLAVASLTHDMVPVGLRSQDHPF